jgi:hypothetical protein
VTDKDIEASIRAHRELRDSLHKITAEELHLWFRLNRRRYSDLLKHTKHAAQLGPLGGTGVDYEREDANALGRSCLCSKDRPCKISPLALALDRRGQLVSEDRNYRHDARWAYLIRGRGIAKQDRTRRSTIKAPSFGSDVYLDGPSDQSREDGAVKVAKHLFSNLSASAIGWVPHDANLHHRRKHFTSPELDDPLLVY